MANKEPKKRLEHDLFDRPVRVGGINSKAKGDANERVVCKLLLKWTGERFIRTPGSGGRRLVNNTTFCGDVVCENQDFDFIFSVETKHLSSVFVATELRKNCGVYKIWAQAKRDAERAGKEPMCILRENGMKAGHYIIFVTLKLGVFLLHKGVKLKCSGETTLGETIIGFDSEGVMNIPYKEIFGFVKNLN